MHAISEENEGDWIALFEDIANARFDEPTSRKLRWSALLGLPKKPDGIRPIAMGEVFVKITARLLLSTDRNLQGSSAVGNYQYAFVKAGAEQVIHRVRQLARNDPSLHLVLVDCKNAFNAIRRKAIRDALMANEELAPLRHLFNSLYVEQGDLIIKGEGGEDGRLSVICGPEGVRQGDVLGSLLFCIGLKPAIERTKAIFEQQFPNKELHLFAYMDDITIAGSEEACFQAYTILKHELEQGLSLMVNVSKTKATSAALGAAIGCPVDTCPKLLGAYIGRRWEDEKLKVDLIPEEHARLFALLPKLPAEVAHHLTTCFGVAKWNYVVRTHEPLATVSASKEFTKSSARCLAAIMGVDYAEFDREAFRQMTLPIRFGGLGLIDWMEVGHVAYACSLRSQLTKDFATPPATTDQASQLHLTAPAVADEGNENADAATTAPNAQQTEGNGASKESLAKDKIWEEANKSIKADFPALATHLENSKPAMASSWLHAELSPASAHASKTYACALATRIRFSGSKAESPTTFRCRCGYPKVNANSTTARQVMMHTLGCGQCGGATRRHHAIRDALGSLLTRAGYVVEYEVPLTRVLPNGSPHAPKDEETLRMDIVAHPPSNAKPLFIDTTVLNSCHQDSDG